MARKKVSNNKVEVGNIRDISGEVSIAGGDIYHGFTAEQVSVLIKQISITFEPKKFDGRIPYKGLDVFEEDDADLFFGREKIVRDLVIRLKESRTLFVTGPSGSGKSSLVRAGLIPALRNGAIKNSERWLYATMKPSRDPFEALASVFSRLKSPQLGDYFQQNISQPEVLHKCVEAVLSERTGQRLVLFIDQFEEIFTQLSANKTETFINLLAQGATIENGRMIILFSMRSDFVSNCATYPQLNALLNQQFLQIGAMGADELVSAIAQPALRVGLQIHPDLIAQIINDMQGEPGALPLMQFALKDLFDSQQAKGEVIALTLNDYLARGGIRKALERHADDSFNKLEGYEQELARSIFSGLIEIGRGTQDTRRTAIFDELIPANTKAEAVEVIVHKLADARLITTDEIAGKDTVTISHEKLIDAWPWLKKLVNENRDMIALQNEIAADAKEWDDHKRDTSYLYAGARLINANEKLKSKELILSGTAFEYIRAGQVRKQRSQIVLIGSISIIFSLLIVALIIFANLTKESQKQTNNALARQLAAQAQSISATRNSKQMIAVLLAIQSMKTYPSSEAAQVLLNNNFAAHLISSMSHNSSVTSVAFSPDGKYVVSGSLDGTARVWEAMTGKEVARMTHESSVISVAFSPDSKYVVSGSYDDTARVWEAMTGKEVARMTHDSSVNSVAFSPDGKYVVSGSYDDTARVWEAMSGKEVALMTHDDLVTSAAFSPDGKYVVSGGYDKVARVWETMTGKEVAHMTHDGGVPAVAFSPDGKYVVSGSYDKVARVWEAMTGKEVAHMTHDGNVYSVAFSPDGKYVVSGSLDGTARVWEAMTGKEVARKTHDGSVSSVAFSPDGKYVVSGSDDHTARVWEAMTGKEVARMTHDGIVYSVAFSSDGKYVVSGSFGNSVRVWEAKTSKEVVHLTAQSIFKSAVYSPDGKYGVSGSYDNNTARVWETKTSKEVAHMTHDGGVPSVAFSPDGKYVVSGSYDHTARVWEAMTGKEVARMTHDDLVISVAFSPDGKYVVSGSFDDTARVWEAMTGKEVARMTHDGIVYSVAFSSDGKYVVSGSPNEPIQIWMWQPTDLILNACAYLPRNLSLIEWKQYIGNILPYQMVCPGLPIKSEPTPPPTPIIR